MKKKIAVLVFCLFALFFAQAQPWMTSLDAAKRLALTQNKMIFMFWEEATFYPLPVTMRDSKGKAYFVRNLFENEGLNEIIWEHFVPVIVSERHYEDMYSKIKNKRSTRYIEKFNDDSVKIMDAAGNIINVDYNVQTYLNLSKYIQYYALNTSYLSSELSNYRRNKDFYSAYFLSSKYIDYSILTNKKIRPKILGLSKIYMSEAESYLENSDLEDEPKLKQRVELLELKKYLIKGKPRKVLRRLKRIEKNGVIEANITNVAFLFYSSHLLLDNFDRAEAWKSKVTTFDLNKAKLVNNIHSN